MLALTGPLFRATFLRRIFYCLDQIHTISISAQKYPSKNREEQQNTGCAVLDRHFSRSELSYQIN